MDKVFIIIPIYNVEKYLERCINSLLEQTYRNIDIVLINDGSTDSSPQICDRFSEKNKNITVIHQINKGLSGARNTGIEYVLQNANENEWITFVDSDDYIHPNYIQYLYDVCIEFQSQISVCKYVRTFDEAVIYPKIDCTHQVCTPEELWEKDRTNAVIAVGKLYNIKCWEKERFPLGKIHEDEFTTYKVLFEQERIVYVPQIMYYYYQTEFSIMHQQWKIERLQGLDALEQQIEYLKKRKFERAYNKSLEALCEHSIKHMRAIEVAAPKYNDYKKGMKARMCRALKIYAKEKGVLNALHFWYRFRIKHPIQKSLKKEKFWSFVRRQIKRRIKCIQRLV